MAQELAFPALRAEDMTQLGIEVAGGGIAAVVEGAVTQFAPQMGAAAPFLTWGTLIGVPLGGAGAALLTKGMMSDLLRGVAVAGTAILAYSLPAMILPELFGKKTTQLTAEQRALLAAGNKVKELPAGPLGAPARAQAAVRSSLEF